jgi:predicted RNA binding protein YcfA (HicA-like mRNA interferase family)
MTKSEKRLQKLRQNPLAVRFADLIKVLEDYGYNIREAKGSHHFVRIEIEGRIWTSTIVRPHGKKKSVDPRSIKVLLNQFEEIDAWREELLNQEDEDE